MGSRRRRKLWPPRWWCAFTCRGCGVNTSDIDEYYMLRDDLWARAQGRLGGMLCIGCVEARRGRRLHAGDFSDAPVNRLEGWLSSAKSARLADRLVSLELPEVTA